MIALTFAAVTFVLVTASGLGSDPGSAAGAHRYAAGTLAFILAVGVQWRRPTIVAAGLVGLAAYSVFFFQGYGVATGLFLVVFTAALGREDPATAASNTDARSP